MNDLARWLARSCATPLAACALGALVFSVGSTNGLALLSSARFLFGSALVLAGRGLVSLMATSAELMAIVLAWTVIGWIAPEIRQALANTKGNFMANSFVGT